MASSGSKKINSDSTMSSSKLAWSKAEKGRSAESKMRRAQRAAARQAQSR